MMYRLDEYSKCAECGQTKKWSTMLIKGNRFYCDQVCRDKENANATA